MQHLLLLTSQNDTTIIIEKALGPQNIDEVINMSKDYWARETVSTRLIEAPPPPPQIREEKVIEEIRRVPIENAPPSVQNWDHLRSPSPKSQRSRRSHRSRSRKAKSRRSSSSSSSSTNAGGMVEKETIIRKESIREVSPGGRSHRARRHSSIVGGGTEIIERKKEIIDEVDYDESDSVHIGPLALVADRRKSRSDREIKEEIRRLEEERRRLRREREDDVEVVKVERVRERSPSRGRGEVIVEKTDGELLEVRKDRRARSRSAAPSPAVIRAMMATLT